MRFLLDISESIWNTTMQFHRLMAKEHTDILGRYLCTLTWNRTRYSRKSKTNETFTGEPYLAFAFSSKEYDRRHVNVNIKISAQVRLHGAKQNWKRRTVGARQSVSEWVIFFWMVFYTVCEKHALKLVENSGFGFFRTQITAVCTRASNATKLCG